MDFCNLIIKERKVERNQRYQELIENGLLDKYFDGKTLEERTRIEGSILDRCQGQTSVVIYETPYCQISMNNGKTPMCKNAGEMDHNGFVICKYKQKNISNQTRTVTIYQHLTSNLIH